MKRGDSPKRYDTAHDAREIAAALTAEGRRAFAIEVTRRNRDLYLVAHWLVQVEVEVDVGGVTMLQMQYVREDGFVR